MVIIKIGRPICKQPKKITPYMAIDLLNNFQAIKIESPTDKITRQIKELITSGQLKPGDRLPSERKLSGKLGVGRTHLRDAIRKLEFYGILKTLPQSGTIVAGIGIAALEGLITDVLKIEKSGFASLIETRVLLESEAARLAATRRTEQDIDQIKIALDAYAQKSKSGNQAVEEDLLFHLEIAKASKNEVLKSLMLIITPDIINNFLSLDICKDDRFHSAMEEHEQILKFIIDKKPDQAAQAMKDHLKDVFDYSQELRNKNTIG